jgi:FAD/FMN-containing dehydrogenase
VQRRHFLQTSLGVAMTAMSTRHASAAIGGYSPSVDAVTLDGRVRTIPAAVLKDLRDSLHGSLLLSGNEGYDDARRLMDPQFDKRPALIVQATGAGDVREAVSFAQDNNLLLAVKCGGHNEFGLASCDRGMMIDLSPMRSVRVDGQARRAWVGGGTLAGLVDHEAVSQGLAIPLGDEPTVGIGGLATGGGIGKLSRRFGLTLDSIRSVDIVSANGRLLYASASENPDLFWAVRGGGGNFGVVTGFEFELHAIPTRVVAGAIAFPFSQLNQVLSAYTEYSAEAPDELYLECYFDVRGTREASILQFNICYSGDESGAEQAIGPVRRFGQVIRDDVKAANYLVIQTSDRHGEARTTAASTQLARDTFFRSGFIEGFDTGLITALSEQLTPHPGRRIQMLFLHAGGAIARVQSGATAFSHRSASHDMIYVTSWLHGDSAAAEHAEYSGKLWTELKKYTRGFYNNEMAGGVSPDEVAVNFGGNYPRLARVKADYDPNNLFRLNANILPKAG